MTVERLQHTGDAKSIDIRARLQQEREQERKLHWEGTFSEYFDKAVDNPNIAQLSHGRIHNMIESAGVTEDEDGVKHYKFFEDEIFGISEPLEQIAEYFKSAAKKTDVRKRILLLMGPPSGGKSTIAAMLKRGLERYTRTDDGGIYAIADCPMHEEPLHLIPKEPKELREDVKKATGLEIEGELCPKCRYNLEHVHDGRSEDVPVKRITFSETDRVGIGTFIPSDPKSQDISELVGRVDLATVGEVGAESDPRAYRFDGELNIANRGMMEFVEMLKSDERFLYVLLELSQNQNIKTGGFSLIYADETIISHTNEHEFNSFVGNKKNEALQDRIIKVKVPYNLRVSDEVRIYNKLLSVSNVDVHIAPQTLETAATMAILSRLSESKKSGMSTMKKLKLYNGEEVEGFTQKDVKELKKEARDDLGDREGMDGISPRYVINQVSSAAANSKDPCINPIDILRSLEQGLSQQTSMTPDQRKKYEELRKQARGAFDVEAKKIVQKAFVYGYEDSAKTIFNNYLDNIEAFCTRSKVKDPITEEEVPPNEKLMRSIEEQINVAEDGKKAFREEIRGRGFSLARKGKTMTYDSHERLREAIEKKLFTDVKDIIKISSSSVNPDPELKKKQDQAIESLIDEHGYCPHCANELLKYVGQLINQ